MQAFEASMGRRAIGAGRRAVRGSRSVVVLGILALAALGACASGEPAADAPAEQALLGGQADQQRTLVLQDIRFAPAAINIKAGEIVELEIRNEGRVTHDFTIDRIEAEVAMQHQPARHAPAAHNAHGEAAVVHLALTAGDRMVARIRVSEPGEYDFYCQEPGHREAGMTGKLIVG